MYGDTRNRRIICRGCNTRLGTCGHCVGALGCIYAVAAPNGDAGAVIWRWGMGAVATAIPGRWERGVEPLAFRDPAHWEDGPEPRSRPTAYPHAAERVAIARVIDAIGLDEFVFPAETAAARVWNLATLARRYSGPVAP